MILWLGRPSRMALFVLMVLANMVLAVGDERVAWLLGWLLERKDEEVAGGGRG